MFSLLFTFWSSCFVAIFDIYLFTMWPTATCQTSRTCIQHFNILLLGFPFSFQLVCALNLCLSRRVIAQSSFIHDFSRHFFLLSMVCVWHCCCCCCHRYPPLASLYCGWTVQRKKSVFCLFPHGSVQWCDVLYKHVEKMIDSIFASCSDAMDKVFRIDFKSKE